MTNEMTSTNRADEFTLIKSARALISGVNSSASKATISQYASAFSRMHSRGLTPEKMANTSRSFYYYRAAWVNHFSTAIRGALNAADQAHRSKNFASWQAEIERLPALIKELERYRPDPERNNLSNGWVGGWAVEEEKRKRVGLKASSHSKRSRLRGLADDWRTQMFLGLKLNSKYRDVVAVLSATGARPSEFNDGICVTRESDDSLRFQIAGSKTSGGKYGQAERSFTVRADRPELQYLLARVEEATGRLIVTAKAGALSDKIRQLSMKVFPLLKSEVSAYVFRHQMAADLKASDISDAEVSQALGHSSDETKGRYGAAQSARSTGGVGNIKSTSPVRQKTRERVMQLERHREISKEYQR